MTWWAYSLLSNVAIMVSEYLHRSVPAGSPWIELLPKVGLVYIVAQFCLFKSYSGAPNWFTAWMVFSIGNSLMRVVAVHLFANGEVTSWSNVSMGIAVMMAGAFLLKEGLK